MNIDKKKIIEKLIEDLRALAIVEKNDKKRNIIAQIIVMIKDKLL